MHILHSDGTDFKEVSIEMPVRSTRRQIIKGICVAVLLAALIALAAVFALPAFSASPDVAHADVTATAEYQRDENLKPGFFADNVVTEGGTFGSLGGTKTKKPETSISVNSFTFALFMWTADPAKAENGAQHGVNGTYVTGVDGTSPVTIQINDNTYKHYINEYMPAGTYTLELEVIKYPITGSGTTPSYPGGSYSESYTFTVNKAKLSNDDAKNLIKECHKIFSEPIMARRKLPNAKLPIDYAFVSVMDDCLKIDHPDYIETLGLDKTHYPEKWDLAANAGYWGTAGNIEKYYSPRKLLFTKDINKDDADQEDLTYTEMTRNIGYYQIVESNYESPFDKKEFTVIPYGVIKLQNVEYKANEYNPITKQNGVFMLKSSHWPSWLGTGIASLPDNTQLILKEYFEIIDEKYGKQRAPLTLSSVDYSVARSRSTDTNDVCEKKWYLTLSFSNPDCYRWDISEMEIENDEIGDDYELKIAAHNQKFVLCYQVKPAVNTWVDNDVPTFSELEFKDDGYDADNIAAKSALIDYNSLMFNNIYDGSPGYGKVSEIKYAVTDKFANDNTTVNPVPSIGKNDKGEVYLDPAVWKTKRDIIAYINTIQADSTKTYLLHMYSAETVNYNGLTRTLQFKVVPIENTWLVEPVMPDFEYGGGINGITARPLYSEDSDVAAKFEVTVRKIGKGDDGGNTYTDIGSYSLSGENNVWSNADFAAALKKADVGDYELSYSFDISANYSVLGSGSGETDKYKNLLFTVTPATNIWQEMPSITQWVYNDTSTIKIFAAAKVGGGTYTVTFDDGDGDDPVDYALTPVTADGETYYENAELSSELKKCIAGKMHSFDITYSIENYTDLHRPVSFYVGKSPNGWAEGGAPAISGWSWNQYPYTAQEDSALYITAKPQCFDLAIGKIYITFGDQTEVFKVKDEHTYKLSAFDDAFKALAADTYRLTVEYRESNGNNNYDNVSSEIGFNVWKASNSWNVAPSLVQWQYGSATINSIGLGESLYGDRVVYTVTADGVTKLEWVPVKKNGAVSNVLALIDGLNTLAAKKDVNTPDGETAKEAIKLQAYRVRGGHGRLLRAVVRH